MTCITGFGFSWQKIGKDETLITTHTRYNLYRQLHISRKKAFRLGQEALKITNDGFYMAPSGNEVDFTSLLLHAVEATESYTPNQEIPPAKNNNFTTTFEVSNETTLSAVRRLNFKGFHPAALNLASAKHPGGGFLNGAAAQEEYLCRSSALYACLMDNPMYSLPTDDPFYTDYVIYSPDVPIFRNDDGKLLEAVELYSVLTCAAVHAGNITRNMPERVPEIASVMEKRIKRVLDVAAAHNHNSLVLGAWGCGVFENDGTLIASLFKKVFKEEFKGVFSKVVFAIADWSIEQQFIEPFAKTFED
jgi:uncharacterized protein (TIGR02452 family)